MATAAQPARAQANRAAEKGYPPGSLRFDWQFIALSALFLAGLWVDGWAHFHGQVDDSFFTPWHFLFYSSFGIVSLFIGYHQYRNIGKGYVFRRALPQGYWLSLLGAALFAVGGLGDMVWHTLFGIEAGSEALTSPTHIILGIGMVLIMTGPLRAAWLRGAGDGWRALGPAIISATLLLALLGFFTSYGHPLFNLAAADFGSTSAAELQQTEQVYVMNNDGSAQTRLTPRRDLRSYGGDWSPDGSRIAFSMGSGGDISLAEEAELYVMNVDGSALEQLTTTGSNAFAPDWSPDGSKIAYVLLVDGRQDIYVLDVDSGESVQLTESSGSEWFPDWSPDSTKIAYGLDEGGVQNIYVMNADGSEPTQLTSGGRDWEPQWSPDGSQVLLGSERDGTFDLYTMNADGTNLTRLTDHHSFDGSGVWSPDGQQIAFLSWRGGTGEIYVMLASGEVDTDVEPVNVSNNTALQAEQPSWSPDGTRILFAARGQSSDSGMSFNMQDFGVATIMLQAGFIAGVVGMLAWRWRLPFGTLTLVLGISTLLLTILTDLFVLVPGALVAGLIADVLLARLKPSPERATQFHWTIFLVPLVYFALYFVTLQLIAGIGWSVHVWAGAIFLAGMIGLLVSYVISVAARPMETAS